MAVSFNISEIRDIADQLTEKLRLPFNQMTHSFLKRRLSELIEKQGIKKSEQLINGLNSTQFRDNLCQLFSVNTTELFRDASFWRQLKKIISNKSLIQTLHFWLPDLSSGEELYSLLILLNEIQYLDKVQIHVNHPSKQALENVKTGKLLTRKMDVNTYNYKRFEGSKKLEDYYHEHDQSFNINPVLFENVRFYRANMLQAPNHKIDIILFRNSMLYYTKEYHYELKATFDKALQPGGIICLGIKEVLPAPYDDRFECLVEKEKIYCKYQFIKE